jgi:hypothetical protein
MKLKKQVLNQEFLFNNNLTQVSLSIYKKECMRRLPILFILGLTLFSCEKKGDMPCIPLSLQNHVIAFYPFSNGSLSDVSGNDLDLVNPK